MWCLITSFFSLSLSSGFLPRQRSLVHVIWWFPLSTKQGTKGYWGCPFIDEITRENWLSHLGLWYEALSPGSFIILPTPQCVCLRQDFIQSRLAQVYKVAKAGFELLTLLNLSSRCCNYKSTPPQSTYQHFFAMSGARPSGRLKSTSDIFGVTFTYNLTSNNHMLNYWCFPFLWQR